MKENVFRVVHSVLHILVEMSNKQGGRAEVVRNGKSFEVSEGMKTRTEETVIIFNEL